MNTRKLLISALAAVAISAFAGKGDSLDITGGWVCQPLSSKTLAKQKQAKDKCPPPLEVKTSEEALDALLSGEDDKPRGGGGQAGDNTLFFDAQGNSTFWLTKPCSLSGMLKQAAEDKYKVTGNPNLDLNSVKKSNFNVWYKRQIEIPKDWNGRFVTFEVELQYIELALFINGEEVAKGGPPSVFIDVSKHLKYGEKNDFRIFFSSQGYGTGPGIRYQGRDECVQWHFESPVMLRTHTSARLEDVWADTSWRKKELSLQCEIRSSTKQKVKVAAEILVDAGRDPETNELLGNAVVKKLEGTFDVDVGTNTVRMTVPWPDAHPWELEDPFLYNCSATMTDEAGNPCESAPKFIFGFREVWRDGKNVMLNGHVQHYRGYWGPAPKNLPDMKKFGFNCIFDTHQYSSRFTMDQKTMEAISRAGIAEFGATPCISTSVGSFQDPVCQEQFRRFAERWAKSVRNWPSLHGASVGVNMLCAASYTMGARDFGRHRTDGKNIGIACDIARDYHPNALYFAHGDGNIQDVGTCNFYFNWTPLQEREEWLQCWSERGEIPCYPCEFGAPYYGSWFPQPAHAPAMTEHCATYFGNRAYELEDEKMLERSRDFAYSSAGNFYGGWADDGPDKRYSLYDLNPAGKELHRLLVERVTRTWRVWGQAISPMYLDEMDWENGREGFELAAHRRSNGLVVSFIGGWPWHTDKTHAYHAGEKIEKSFSYVWDGGGENTYKAEWKVADDATGQVIASGRDETLMKPGESKRVPFSFIAPDVAKRTSYTISAKFSARDIDDTVESDSFAVEVYPALERLSVPDGKSIALFDPRGESAPILELLGLPFEKATSLDALVNAKATHLVVGRRALDKMGDSNRVERLAAKAQEGKHVMVMAQYPATWQKMGFKIEDCMPRQLWNTFLPDLDEKDLSFWRGLPLPMRDGGAWQYDADWGHVQEQPNGSRSWRWYHTHALASEVFQISTRTLFRPLVRGEFDMMYTPIMRATTENGSATMCAFDFYRRALSTNAYLSCPAAEATARAVFKDFLAPRPAATAKVFTAGETAARLAQTLGLDAAPWTGAKIEAAVLILGDDAKTSFEDVRGALGRNARAFIVDNEALASGAGFELHYPQKKEVQWKSEKADIYDDLSKIKPPAIADVGDLAGVNREDISLDEVEEEKPKAAKPKWMTDKDIPRVWTVATNTVDASYLNTRDVAKFGEFPFAGVGPQHLRWRWHMRIKRMKPQNGWTVAGDGVFAVSDDKKILIDMMKPFKYTDERKERKDRFGLYNVSLSQDNQLRRYSLVLENWDVKPSSVLLERAFTIPKVVPKGEQAPKLPNLYWSECPDYDPYWFCYW